MDNDDDEIMVVVSGKEFKTTRKVLEESNGFFSMMTHWPDRRFIVDHRSHSYFQHILTFMEDGSLPKSATLEELLWLKEEFNYYSMTLPPATRESIVFVNRRVTKIDLETGDTRNLSRTRVPEPPPYNDHEDYTVESIKGQIYLIGGGNDYRDIWSYDVSTDIWNINLPKTSIPREGPIVVVVGTYLYLIGATEQVFERYDTEGKKWEILPSIPIPINGFIAGMCAVGTDIYAFIGSHPAGKEEGEQYNTYQFDSIQFQWSMVKTSGVPSSLLGSMYSTVEVDGMVYLTSIDRNRSSFYRFDPKEGRFTQMASPSVVYSVYQRDEGNRPDDPSGHTIGVLNGTIYYIHQDGIEQYDRKKDRWTNYSTATLIRVQNNMICTIVESPRMETRLDDLIAQETVRLQKIWRDHELQLHANQERQQCMARCQSGKRCTRKKRGEDEDECFQHMDGNHHDDLCDKEDEENRGTEFHLGRDHSVQVSTDALFHIPKDILQTLYSMNLMKEVVPSFKEMTALLCLQNVLQRFPLCVPSYLFLFQPTLDDNYTIMSSKEIDVKVKTKHWTELMTRGHLFAQYQSFQGSLYMIGQGAGWIGQSPRVVMKCSSIDQLWEPCPEISLKIVEHCVTVAESKIFVFGQNVDDGESSVQSFDGITWNVLTPPPRKFRSGMVACTVDSKIYLFTPFSQFIQMECYDVITDKWSMSSKTTSESTLDPLEMIESQINACVCENTIYIKGYEYLIPFDPVTGLFGKGKTDRLLHRCVEMGGKLHGLSQDGYIYIYNVQLPAPEWKPTGILISPFSYEKVEFTSWCPTVSPPSWLDNLILQNLKFE
jgi:hypothetical protein